MSAVTRCSRRRVSTRRRAAWPAFAASLRRVAWAIAWTCRSSMKFRITMPIRSRATPGSRHRAPT